MKLKLRLEQDQDAQNPREEFDNAGTMVCWHRRYHLGDGHDFEDPQAFLAWWKAKNKSGKGVLLSLYLYDHSGITMSTSPFSCPWDSGQVGFIYCLGKTIRAEWGGDKAKAEKYLCGEVEVYDHYLTGDVWGAIVEDDDGNTIDSCWGFYGEEYAQEEGESMLESAQENQDKIERETALAECCP